MRISQIIIDGFRGIKHAKLYIPPHCVIIGANNSGKTTIVDALGLLLGRNQWFQHISEYDFYGGNPTNSSRFNLITTITDFDTENPLDIPQWFNFERSGHPIWWLEKEKDVSYKSECPKNGKLAVQIALSGRFDEEACEFDLRRYFYDGETDPFTLDPFVPISQSLLKELGVQILPCSRQWDKILSFGSAQFLKILRESDSLPGTDINTFKKELMNPSTQIEKSGSLSDLLKEVESELKSFLLMPDDSNIIYRTHSITSDALLKSLSPHLKASNETIIPFSKQGAGFISLQLFLVLLELAKQLSKKKNNIIFIAEEPELHLHQSLQGRLIQRMRAYSNQVIITTHSPHIASMYKPSNVLYIQNHNGEIKGDVVFDGDINSSSLGNQERRLYLQSRIFLYEALLGQFVIIPEGPLDWQWLTLWKSAAELYMHDAKESSLKENISPTAINLIKTENSNICPTLKQIRKFKRNVVVILDGDQGGKDKIQEIKGLDNTYHPNKVIQFGENGTIEDLSAWILEPSLKSPGKYLSEVLIRSGKRPENIDKALLGVLLKEESNYGPKANWELHENLAWEAAEKSECLERILGIVTDIVKICTNTDPILSGWEKSEISGTGIPLYKSLFISGIMV